MCNKQFVHLHMHTDRSNSNMFECVSKPEDYIKLAQEQGAPAVAFTEHGTILNWVQKKQMVEKAGLKYIHAIEAYVTESLDEKVRDNYHLTMIAKNEEGVKEINKLSSIAHNREDGHYYFNPRNSFEEIKNTSDNIIILTACLGNPLWQHAKNKNKEAFSRWMNFFAENKHRVYLEVQPHTDPEQVQYNKILLRMAEKHGMNLVATNDVHALNEEHDNLRQIMKKAKKIEFAGEDELDLTAKSRDAMIESFETQGVLTREQVETALDNTMVIVDSIDEFEFERSIKYPQLYDNPEEEFQKRIKKGLKTRNIARLPKETQKQYAKRIKHEYATYKKTGSVNYMLLERTVKDFTEPEKIYSGYGRGSVSGSLIAYLIGLTEMDSIEHGLNFERFMNPERISLADIDSDYYKPDRDRVQKFLLEHPDLTCASIVTKNTVGLKGAIKDIGRSMGYNADLTNEITKKIDDDGDYPFDLYEAHKELFDTAFKVVGVMTSIGRHAAGVVVTTRDLVSEMGTMTISKWEYPVTELTMKEVDFLNFVKLDVLGLDNIGLINITADLVGLPRLTPDSTDIIDFEDEKVWDSMRESNIGIFQFEGVRAGKLVKDMFEPQVISKIKKQNPDLKMIDLLATLNAAQRPSGASYLDALLMGEFHDNGHKALNDFFKDTLGYLVYQEQQTAFLEEFCGWSTAQADLIRRGIGKKDHKIMDEEVPKIKPSFIKTMVEKYGDTEEHATEVADSFVQVFLDSVNYGFSINHASAYSYIGYICTWLRYYYPVEFCTAGLIVWGGDQEKTVKLLEYAESKNIKLEKPKFRYSKGEYFMDTETKTIYQGTSPIKNCNMKSGDDLYSLKDEEFKNWIDFMLRIKDGTSLVIDGKVKGLYEIYTTYTEEEVKALDKDIKANPDKYEVIGTPLPSLDKRNMEPLIKLNYFSEFGNPKQLMTAYELFNNKYKPKNKTYAGKFKNFNMILDAFNSKKIDDYKAVETLENELFYTGRVTTSFEHIPGKYAFVTDIIVRKTRTTAKVFNIKHGKMVEIKVGSKLYNNVPFEPGDLIEIVEGENKPKNELVGSKWVKSETKKEYWVKRLKSIRKNKLFDAKKER